ARPPSPPLFPYPTLFRSGVGHEIPGREIVGPVGDEIVTADEIDRVRGPKPYRVGFDPDVRIEPFDDRCRTLDFPMTDVGRAVNRSEEHTSELQSLAYLVC